MRDGENISQRAIPLNASLNW